MSSVKFERGSWGAVHKLCHLGREEGGRPKDDLLHRPYLIKKRGRGSKIAAFETTQFMDGPLYKKFALFNRKTNGFADTISFHIVNDVER